MSTPIRKWFIVIFSLLLIGNIAFILIRGVLKIKKYETTNRILFDSLESTSSKLAKVTFEKEYISRLRDIDLLEGIIDINKITLFDVDDSTRKKPINFVSVGAPSKEKLIIRYTEIGCNACTDSVFNQLRVNSNLGKKYDVLVLVDFTNYEYYLKWRKIAEVNEKILWLEKGSLPFPIENANSSYIFTIGRDGKASRFFIPNSMLTVYLKSYLKNL